MSLTEVPDLEPGPRPPRHRRASGIHEPPNPVQIEMDLLNLLDELEDASVEYHEICRDAALSEMTEKMKVAKASLESNQMKQKAALARELQRSKFAFLTGLHERIGALRTICANYRKST